MKIRRDAPLAVPLALTGLAAAALAAGAGPGHGPEPDEREAVLAVVQRFFDAMAAADTAASRRTLDMDGRWFGVRPGSGGPTRFTRTHREYVEAMPGRSERVLERMWDPTVLVHGDVAVVWTPYDFHVDGRFSHCGVDAFSLIRGEEGWKIAGVVFTMEPEGCDPSPLGPPAAPGAAGSGP